jgi:hypothetical protein
MENAIGRLPESCAIGVHDGAGALIIRRGEPGFTFYRSVVPNEWNDAFTVTSNQISAMLLGAVTGWRSAIVDPDLFDASGYFIEQLVMDPNEPPDEMSLCAFWCAERGLSGDVVDDGHLPAKVSIKTRDRIRENRQAFIAVVRFRSAYWAGSKFARAAFRSSDDDGFISQHRFDR